MLLHLLRHADAGDPLAWDGPDARRPLSDKGRGQAERLGAHLAAIGADLGPFLTSPKVRAFETAEIVARALGAELTVEHRLGGAFDRTSLEAILAERGDPERVCLVGHDPDFSEILADLLGVRELPMRKGAVVRLDVDRPLESGAGTLRWLLPPNLIKS